MCDYKHVPTTLIKNNHVILMTATEWEGAKESKTDAGDVKYLIRNNEAFPVKIITLTKRFKRRWQSAFDFTLLTTLTHKEHN